MGGNHNTVVILRDTSTCNICHHYSAQRFTASDMMPMKALAEALRLLSALRKPLTDEVHAVIWRFNSAACFSNSFLCSIRCLSSLEPSILSDSFFTHASTEELNFATACAVLPIGLSFLSNKAIRASTTSRQAPLNIAGAIEAPSNFISTAYFANVWNASYKPLH